MTAAKTTQSKASHLLGDVIFQVSHGGSFPGTTELCLFQVTYLSQALPISSAQADVSISLRIPVISI